MAAATRLNPLFLMLMLMGLQLVSGSVAYAQDAQVSVPSEEKAIAKAFHAINASRRKAKLPALLRDSVLDLVAYSHAIDMARSKALNHRSKDGSAPELRVSRAGITANRVGENIARHTELGKKRIP